ncbi:MAG TPA: carboxypeptidase regulatory-like domain-containing protein [Planctomycetota bacterium]|nr:carboxypeptidase regulatory-like domain-containing protein [Planctomycetota bacterium]
MPSKLLTRLTAALAVALLIWLSWPVSNQPALVPQPPALPIAEAVTPSTLAENQPLARQQITAAATPALRVFGRVLDRAGEPIAAATLQLKAGDAAGSNDPVLGGGITTTDGSFEIDCDARWPQPFRIFAAAPGCASLSQDPIVPGREVTLRLYRLTWLFGRVAAKDTQAPLVGAKVSGWEQQAFTDSFGGYELRGAAVGADTSVVARCDGFVEERTTLRVNEPGRTELNFTLQPAVALALQVVDRDTKAPIAGAAVRQFGPGPVLVRSDAYGRCTLQVGDGRDLHLAVSAIDHCPMSWSWQVTDAANTLVTLPLQGCATLEGRVVDEHGAPLARVFVTAENEADRFERGRLTAAELQALRVPGSVTDDDPDHGTCTDEQGRFTIAVRPAASPWRVDGAHDDYVAAQSQPVVLAAAGRRALVELTMRRAGVVHGTVLRNREPFRGTVRGRAVGETAWGLHARIESDGTYELKRVPAGALEIGVFAEATSSPLHGATVQVVAGQRVQHDFTWQVATGKITGKVASASGRPLADVVVRAATKGALTEQASSRAGVDGRYTLVVEAGRSFTICVNRGVTAASRDDVEAGASGVDFVLPDLGHVRLRLLDAASREPVRKSGLWTLAWRTSGAEAFRELRLRPDANGGIDMELPVGAADVVVSMLAAGYAPQHALGLPVLDQAAPEPIEVLLERGVQVRVELVGASPAGDDMKDHLLFLLHSSQLDLVRGPFAEQGGPSNHRINGINMWIGEPGLMHQLLSLKDDGAAVLKGLLPGSYCLRAFPDEFVFTPAMATVGPGNGTVRLQWQRR